METATKFDSCYTAQRTIECLADSGIKDVAVVEFVPQHNGSFAVCYIRPEDIQANGHIKSNKLNPSKRRFATLAEAIQHGGRFNVRRKNAQDKNGTAGHRGFYVIPSKDAPNAEINWETGLTNPIGG